MSSFIVPRFKGINSLSPEFMSLKDRITKDKEKFEAKKAEVQTLKNNINGFETRINDLLLFQKLFQKATSETQKKLEFKISELVSMALAAVFPDPYDFKTQFLIRRNQTECDFKFSKNGNDFGDILFASGGGPVDVSAFALRCSFWCMNKSRNAILLDEPFRFVNDNPSKETRGLQKKCVEMLKMIATKLGLQMIIVTTLPEFLNVADKTFFVEIDQNGITKVIEGEENGSCNDSRGISDIS